MTPKPKTRVAVVVPSLCEGGGVPAVARFVRDTLVSSEEHEIQLISLATSSNDDCSVAIAKPQTWLRGIRSRAAEWEGYPYVHVGAFGTEFEFQRFRRRSALDAVIARADLIHVIAGGAAWGLPFLNSKKPLILHIATRAIIERQRRESLETGPIAWWRRGMTRITDRLEIRALRRADAVLVMNPWMEQFASRVTGGRCVIMAPPGVDTNTFYPLPIRHDLAAEPYILSVSRFDDPRKNVDLLLTAYQRLLQIVPAPPRLLLAGSGRPPERVMRRMRELGLDNKVHFHHRPSQAELSRYYREALCFVLSSDEEGFGIVVTEAMASGVPVVATRCGGPDGIVNDGVDGFLVEVGDAEGLAQKVASLVIDRDLNSRMGLEARLTADSRFSRQATKQAILKAYDVVRHRAVVG